MAFRKKAENKEKKGKRAVIVACVLVLVLVGCYCGLCAGVGGEVIYPNVTASGVELSGLTKEEAQALLTEQVPVQSTDNAHGVYFAVETETAGPAAQRPEGSGPEDSVKTETVSVPLSSVRADWDATAQRALDVGNSQSFPLRGAVYLKCLLAGQEVLPAYTEGEELSAILDDADKLMGQQVVESTWETDEESLIIHKGELGILLSREDLKNEIFERLGSGDMVELTADAEPQFTVQLQKTEPAPLDFAAILGEVEREVQNAEFNKEQKLFQTESVGISFDVENAKTLYDQMGWGVTDTLPLIITQPEVTLADLNSQLFQDTLGSCTTSISGSENRVKNVARAAELFTGTVLMPGEQFSYNGTVGSRTREAGFLPAPAYVGGASVDEIGGGVCQGSSTIYLAALRANLEIVERHNHSYITRYVPDGMDATVYYGSLDLLIKNDTPFPIKIVGSVSGRELTVNIMGTKSDNITVEMTNKVTGTTGYKTVYQVGSGLSAGSTKVSVTPYTGYTVDVYRNVYDNGKLIDTKLESHNIYKSRDQVILVSAADAYKYGIPGYSAPKPATPAPAPAETPAETPAEPTE